MQYTTLFAVAAVFACSSPKEQQKVPRADTKIVEWSAVAATPRIARDGTGSLTVQLQATIVDGWHVYSLTQTTGGPVPMTVNVSAPYSIAGDIQAPVPVKANDPNFGIKTETYSGRQVFRIPLELAASHSVAPPPIELKVRSQACSDRLCLPAKTTTITVTPGS